METQKGFLATRVPTRQSGAAEDSGILKSLRFTRGRNGTPVAKDVEIEGVGLVLGIPVTAFKPAADQPVWYETRLYPTTHERVYKAVPVSWGQLRPEETPGQITCFGRELKVVKDELQGRGKQRQRYVLLRYVPEQHPQGSSKKGQVRPPQKESGAIVHIREGLTPPTEADADRRYILGTSTRSLSYVLIGSEEPTEISEEVAPVVTGTASDPLGVYQVATWTIEDDGKIEGPVYRFPDTLLGFLNIEVEPEQTIQRKEFDDELQQRLDIEELDAAGKRRRKRVETRQTPEQRAAEIENIRQKVCEQRLRLIDAGVMTPETIRKATDGLLRPLVRQWMPDALPRQTHLTANQRRRVEEVYPDAKAGIENAERALLDFCYAYTGLQKWSAEVAAAEAAREAATTTSIEAKPIEPKPAARKRAKAANGRSPAKARGEKSLTLEELEQLARPYVDCLNAVGAGRQLDRSAIALALFTRLRVSPQEVKNLGLDEADLVSELLAAGVSAKKVRALLDHLKNLL